MMRGLVAIVALIAARALALDLQAPLAEYVVSSEFGYRMSPMGGSVESFHGGLDLRGPPGSPVLAAADGVVVEVWPPPGERYRGHPVYGGMVMISHEDGRLITLYGHLSAIRVREGYQAAAGEPIGVQGSTGMSTAAHLHFEIRVAPKIPPSPEWKTATDRAVERVVQAGVWRARKELLR